MPWILVILLLALLAYAVREGGLSEWHKEASPTVTGKTSHTGLPFSMDEIEARAMGVGTREKLEATLGKPDSVDMKGSLEFWSYQANDGRIAFVFVKDAAGPAVIKSPGK